MPLAHVQDVLTEARKAAGLSVEELAARAGVSAQRLHRCEAGLAALNAFPLACVAFALGLVLVPTKPSEDAAGAAGRRSSADGLDAGA
jgi:transcriptional regulator with XRE-family HTH domain